MRTLYTVETDGLGNILVRSTDNGQLITCTEVDPDDDGTQAADIVAAAIREAGVIL